MRLLSMLTLLLAVSALSPAFGAGVAARVESRMKKNPIRKVVTMIQEMQKSVEEEGEKEAELYDKFMCHCKTESGNLEDAISNGEAKVEELESEIKDQDATKSQLEQEIEGHKADRTDAERQVKEASALREKEEAEFAESSGEMKSNIDSIASALEALKKAGSASLLQTDSKLGDALREAVARNAVVGAEERNALLSFLSAGEGDESAGSSDQIIGVLSQMLDETKAALADATASEADRKANTEALLDAKSKEIKAASMAIESKMDRSGQAAVKMVEAKGSHADFEKALATDKSMRVNLSKECAQREKEYQETTKTRADEMSALSEAVKVLNDDDALELFKKTAPSASFLQTSSRSSLKARSGLRSHMRGHSRLLLAQHQRRVRAHLVSSKGFEKVVGMVDGMVEILKEEDGSDAARKEHCVLGMQETETKKKELEAAIKALESNIEEKSDEVSEIVAEIGSMKDGIAALDKMVAETTEQRKQEHASFVASTAANNAAVDLLKMAVNKLNKFYNPSNYVEPAKEEPELVQSGDVQDGIFFAQTRSRTRARVRAPAAAGIFALLAQITKEVELKMGEEKHDEDEAQVDYEQAMKEAAEKRATDSQVIVTAEVTKSEGQAAIEDLKAQKSEKATILKFTVEKLTDLHKFCDDLLETFDARQKARAAEIESDQSSKQILQSVDSKSESR